MKAYLLLIGALLIAGPASGSGSPANGLAGPWTYRSFYNEPTPVGNDQSAALKLIFGEGHLELRVDTSQKVTGTLDLEGGYVLDISGSELPGSGSSPTTLNMRGTGRKGTSTEGWIYDYQGFLTPRWPNGIAQRDAIVGTVIRVVAHGPKSPAGATASFIAVRD